jgi:hypothetical protein
VTEDVVALLVTRASKMKAKYREFWRQRTEEAKARWAVAPLQNSIFSKGLLANTRRVK